MYELARRTVENPPHIVELNPNSLHSQATANTSGFFFPLDYYQHKAIFADMSVLANGHPTISRCPATPAGRLAGQAEQARRTISRALRQLLDVRDNLHARLQNPEVEDKDFAQLARAHKDVVKQIMDLQGYGPPKSVPARNDPGAKPRKPSAPAGPLPDKPDA